MNTITIELCAEDRARLDRLQATLDKMTFTEGVVLEGGVETTTEAPAEEQLPEQLNISEVTEPEKAPEPQPEPEAPKPEVVKVDRADIQKKVVALSGAGKKAEVRGIVLAYGNTKVSDIPEDKLAEVMEKLTALEG